MCSVTMPSWFVKHSISIMKHTYTHSCMAIKWHTLLHYVVVFLDGCEFWCCYFLMRASFISWCTHTQSQKYWRIRFSLTLGVNNQLFIYTTNLICIEWDVATYIVLNGKLHSLFTETKYKFHQFTFSNIASFAKRIN